MRAATLVGCYVLEPGRGGGGLDLGWSAGGNGVLARTTLAAVGFRRSSTSAVPRLDSQVLHLYSLSIPASARCHRHFSALEYGSQIISHHSWLV